MSILALPEFRLTSSQRLGAQFIAHDLHTFHAAATHVWRLPYGRTSNRAEYRQVLSEERGTCSTKHALLSALAREHGHAVPLVLGIYAMHEQNTPGVGAVLDMYGLAFLPEAHCYVRAGGQRVDLTRTGARAEPIATFLLEEEIAPAQIGRYKVELHQRVLRTWAAEQGHDFEFVWQVRERCIETLSRAPAR